MLSRRFDSSWVRVVQASCRCRPSTRCIFCHWFTGLPRGAVTRDEYADLGAMAATIHSARVPRGSGRTTTLLTVLLKTYAIRIGFQNVAALAAVGETDGRRAA